MRAGSGWGRVVSLVREMVRLSPSSMGHELGTRAKAYRCRCEVNEGGRVGAGAGHDLLVAVGEDKREGEGASSFSSDPCRPRHRIVPVVTSSSLRRPCRCEVGEDEREGWRQRGRRRCVEGGGAYASGGKVDEVCEDEECQWARARRTVRVVVGGMGVGVWHGHDDGASGVHLY